jgi:hypothetical protein
MAEEYYGQSQISGSMDIKTVQERCREYYAISDFVVVMNIDTEPFAYQIQRPENFDYEQPDPVTMNVVMTKPPERIVLQPGETRLCPAYEADLMIKNLMDKMIYRSRGSAISEAKEKGEENVNIKESVMDPETQHRYIKEIYQGKKDFLHEYNQSIDKVKSDVAKDLEDDEPVTSETPRRPGRPAKQAA